MTQEERFKHYLQLKDAIRKLLDIDREIPYIIFEEYNKLTKELEL